ncbi:hypothetical protein [Micromonospora sp. NBC_00858]|uniref:hypothetical protein n=1 Tax=Micromonospora sp. NBC_00858 TaxID=2975979 RepID=UPI00386F8203|nr:hypothetical protein OG990_16085 [Micromonospora sp. NBC_00858]
MESTGFCLVLAVTVMCALFYFVWSRARGAGGQSPGVRPGVDDGRWLQEGEERYQRLVSRHYGSPETIAAGGVQRLRAGDQAAALFFFQKAIDLLHTHHVVNEMSRRRPSDVDGQITDAYLDTLASIRAERPTAPVAASVQEVTHRLRTISTACQDAGIDPSRYLTALTRLGQIAPDINVSRTFWRNPTMGQIFRDGDEADHG